MENENNIPVAEDLAEEVVAAAEEVTAEVTETVEEAAAEVEEAVAEEIPAAEEIVEEIAAEEPVVKAAPQVQQAPAAKLKTNRSLLKFILLSIITLGIYAIVVMSNVSTSINTVASRYDGKKTMHYCLIFFIFTALTCGIATLVWYHRLSKRIGNELVRRGIDYKFGAGTFWGWNILGACIVVGPFIYTHKLLKSMNLLCADYNEKG